MHGDDLIQLPARRVVAGLRAGEISPLECLGALAARIEAVDPLVNALPVLCLDRARKAVEAISRKPLEERGLLAGLPIVIKDLSDVGGVRTTHGSPIFANHVPMASAGLVEHIEEAGGIVYAKSNTPEFGAGANTFNEVFGRTLNPWNTTRSAAGSSGGSAVALATGMAWLAHGSDMGGSLRNPASFCGVCGMRPSPGRVASAGWAVFGGRLSLEGPMARDVEDLALFLDAMTGAKVSDPLSLPAEGLGFSAIARNGRLPRRVAFSPDLGITPVDPEVAAIVEAAARRLENAGVVVEQAHPDLSEAHECFQILRAFSFALEHRTIYEVNRSKLKPELAWNIEKGLSLSVDEIIKAQHQRAELFERTIDFFKTYDLLLTPATITAAFPVEQRYLEACNGVKFTNYVEWLAIVYAITLVSCPAAAIPAGFTKEHLPIGIQIVGPPKADGAVLRGAKLLEDLLDLPQKAPIEPRFQGQTAGVARR